MWERRERESSEGEFERKCVRDTGGTWAVGESAEERAQRSQLLLSKHYVSNSGIGRSRFLYACDQETQTLRFPVYGYKDRSTKYKDMLLSTEFLH